MAKLKEWRAIATRYEKTAVSFMGVLCLAAALDWLERRPALAFGDDPALLTASLPIDRDALVAEAGLDVLVGRGTTLGIAYTGQSGSAPRITP